MQTECVDDLQSSVDKQKQMLQQSEALKENVKKENHILQDEYDRCRMKLKTVEMKCSKLETRLREVLDENEKQKEIVKISEKESQQKKNLLVSSDYKESELMAKIEKLEEKLKKCEGELKQEKRRSEELSTQEKNEVKIKEVKEPEKDEIEIKPNNTNTEKTNVDCLKCKSFQREIAASVERNRKLEIICESLKTQVSSISDKKELNNAEVVTTENNEEDEQDNKIDNVSEDEPNDTVNQVKTEASNEEFINTPLEESVDSNKQGEKTSEQMSSTSVKPVLSNKSIQVEMVAEQPNFICEKCESADAPQEKGNDREEDRPQHEDRASSPLPEGDFAFLHKKIFAFVKLASNLSKEKKSDLLDIQVTMPSLTTSDEGTEKSNEEKDMSKLLAPPNAHVQAQRSNEHKKMENLLENAENDERSDKDETISTLPHTQEYSKTDSSELQPDEDGLHRSWTESGFFDNQNLANQDKRDANENESKWKLIKRDKLAHVIHFLNSIAQTKCSYLKEKVSFLNDNIHGKEEMVKSELNAFAEHAVEILGIISFVVQRMKQNSKTVMEEPPETMMTKVRSTWQPINSPIHENKKSIIEDRKTLQFKEPEIPAAEMFFPDIPIPSLVKVEEPSLPPHHINAVPAVKTKISSAKKRSALLAEKKRQKILDRHKKLVERLRASGCGLQQIYTILGIQKR